MTSAVSGGHVAAIDLGATSGRVVLAHVSGSELRAETVARFPNTPVRTPDGLHWDVLGLYGAAVRGLGDAFRQAPGIASIGIDSWAVDYGLLRNGVLLGNPYHYRDERTARGVLSVHSRMRHPDLYRRNGLQFLPFNTLYQFAAERRDVLDLADTALLIPDLVAYWLTGQARTELTNASTTGLLRVDDQRLDDDLFDRLGLRRSLLAPLIAPGESYGVLLDEVRVEIGAPGAVPVTAIGSHDTASAVVAVPMADAAASAYISCGTWGLVGLELPSPVVTDAAREAGFTNEGGVDSRVRFLHNVMGLWILSETVRGWEAKEGHAIDLPTLLDSAAEVPAASVPVFDVDDPRFLRPGDMPGRIDAWCDEHGVRPARTRAEYARAIVESLADAFARNVHTAAQLAGVDVATIHIVGGGALNTLLCQRTADRSGLVVEAGPVEATALGNVLVQARAAGFAAGSLEALRDLVRRTHAPLRYTPTATS